MASVSPVAAPVSPVAVAPEEPVAAQAVLASFRTEMAARVQGALTEVLEGIEGIEGRDRG